MSQRASDLIRRGLASPKMPLGMYVSDYELEIKERIQEWIEAQAREIARLEFETPGQQFNIVVEDQLHLREHPEYAKKIRDLAEKYKAEMPMQM